MFHRGRSTGLQESINGLVQNFRVISQQGGGGGASEEQKGNIVIVKLGRFIFLGCTVKNQ